MTDVGFSEYDSVESPANDYLSNSFEASSVSTSRSHSSSTVSVETGGDQEASSTPHSDDLQLQFQSSSSPSGTIGRDSRRSSDGDAGLIADVELGCDRPAVEFLTRKVQMLEWKNLEEEGGSGAALSQHTKPTAYHAAERSFCKECIRRLDSSGNVASCPGSAVTASVKGPQSEEPVAMGAVGRRQLERLKFEAVKCKMRSQAEQISSLSHSAEKCPFCRQQQHEVARRQFLHHQTHQLSKPTLEGQLEQHLYYRDSATLLAEVVNSCIRPSAGSEEVWEELRNRMDRNNKGSTFIKE